MRDAMASGEFAVSLSGAQQLALIDYQTLRSALEVVLSLVWAGLCGSSSSLAATPKTSDTSQCTGETRRAIPRFNTLTTTCLIMIIPDLANQESVQQVAQFRLQA